MEEYRRMTSFVSAVESNVQVAAPGSLSCGTVEDEHELQMILKQKIDSAGLDEIVISISDDDAVISSPPRAKFKVDDELDELAAAVHNSRVDAGMSASSKPVPVDACMSAASKPKHSLDDEFPDFCFGEDD